MAMPGVSRQQKISFGERRADVRPNFDWETEARRAAI